MRAVRFTAAEALGRYASSEWAERGFCTRCGTTLYYFLKPAGTYAISVGAFADPTVFRLVREICIDRKSPPMRRRTRDAESSGITTSGNPSETYGETGGGTPVSSARTSTSGPRSPTHARRAAEFSQSCEIIARSLEEPRRSSLRIADIFVDMNTIGSWHSRRAGREWIGRVEIGSLGVALALAACTPSAGESTSGSISSTSTSGVMSTMGGSDGADSTTTGDASTGATAAATTTTGSGGDATTGGSSTSGAVTDVSSTSGSSDTTGDGTTSPATSGDDSTTGVGEVCDDEPLTDMPQDPCDALTTQAECERAGCTYAIGLRFTAEDCQCVSHGGTGYCVAGLADFCPSAPEAYYRVVAGVAEVMVLDPACGPPEGWASCHPGSPPALCACGCSEGAFNC